MRSCLVILDQHRSTVGLGNQDVPIRQKLFWRDGSFYKPRMWITAHDDVRYAVAILRLIVFVLQDPSCSHRDSRWRRSLVTDEKKGISPRNTNDQAFLHLYVPIFTSFAKMKSCKEILLRKIFDHVL